MVVTGCVADHDAFAVLQAGQDFDAHVDAPTIFAQAPEAMRERMVGMTAQMYGGNAQFARDEAIRGASLASMTLMYARDFAVKRFKIDLPANA